MKIEIALSGK